MIYLLVLGCADRPVHLEVIPKRSIAIPCTSPTEAYRWRHECRKPIDAGIYSAVTRSHRGLLSVPLSCRRGYLEMVDLLYTHYTFSISEALALLYIRDCTLPQRWSKIRYLDIDVPVPHCLHVEHSFDEHTKCADLLDGLNMLKDMPSLQRLTIFIQFFTDKQETLFKDGSWIHLLQPLMDVHAQEFRVFLPHRSSQFVYEHFPDAPFQLIQERTGFDVAPKRCEGCRDCSSGSDMEALDVGRPKSVMRWRSNFWQR